jgi:hypothetical protein
MRSCARKASVSSSSWRRGKSLLEVLVTLEPIDEEFPTIEDLPPEPVEL